MTEWEVHSGALTFLQDILSGREGAVRVTGDVQTCRTPELHSLFTRIKSQIFPSE